MNPISPRSSTAFKVSSNKTGIYWCHYLRRHKNNPTCISSSPCTILVVISCFPLSFLLKVPVNTSPSSFHEPCRVKHETHSLTKCKWLTISFAQAVTAIAELLVAEISWARGVTIVQKSWTFGRVDCFLCQQINYFTRLKGSKSKGTDMPIPSQCLQLNE